LNEKPTPPPPDVLETGPELTLCTCFRHSGWQTIRRQVFESMTRTGQREARRRSFCQCGEAAWLYVHEDHPNLFKVKATHCRDRLCTPCASARSHRVADALATISKGKKLKHIVLTIAGHGEKLEPMVDRLYAGFKALRHMPVWIDNCRGGVALLEIKWNDKAMRWHPHLHILADTDYMEQGELSNLWRTITKDSFRVWIEAVGDGDQMRSYITKYASKPLSVTFMNTPVLLDEAMVTLKGRRLVFCFGEWYGTPLSDFENEEMNEEEDWSKYKPFRSVDEAFTDACAGDEVAIRALTAAGVYQRMQDFVYGTSPDTS
jgi:hypothetical protein